MNDQLIAVSIRQPYATMVMLGWKRIETKTTNTRHRGTILIHASNTVGAAERRVAEREGLDLDSLPRGAILGSVDIVDAVPVENLEGLTDAERSRGDYRPGRWGWVLERARPLTDPISCKGALSFWKIPDDIAAQVRGQIKILERVFVYGTLKRGFWNHRLLETSRFLGSEMIRGRMHSLGGYPAIALVGRKPVHGELYAVDDVTMARLDRLEGCPSFYQRARVRMSSGGHAWVYVMDESELGDREVVESGRWEGQA